MSLTTLVTRWPVRLGTALIALTFITRSAVADESAWSQDSSSPSPSARWNASIIYDSSNDRVILFGGQTLSSDGSSVTYNAEVWSFSLSTHQWTQLSPSGSAPAARAYAPAAYHAPRQRMLVFGGHGATALDNTVYALSLSGSPTWSTVSTSGGGPTNGDTQEAIYDPDRDQLEVVTFTGGVWKLYGSSSMTWSQITDNNDGWTGEASLIYDGPNHRLILFGGYYGTGSAIVQGACGTGRNPTDWVRTLDLNQSTPVWSHWSTAPSGFNKRYGQSVVYDATRSRLLVFCGARWSQFCTGCQNICPQNLVVTADVPKSDAWTVNLTSGTWTQLSPTGGPPTARAHQGAVYSSAHDEVTMFGGGSYAMDGSHVDCVSVCTPTTSCTSLSDTWTFRPDVIAPSTISLSLSAGCYDYVTLSWFAPGDDGTTGTAAAYDLRWSTSAITSSNFSGASAIATSAPLSSGSSEQYVISVPRCSGVRYYAIKARDEAMNWSAVSNSPSAQPVCPTPPLSCDAVRPYPTDEPAAAPASLTLKAPSPNPVSTGLESVEFGVPNALDGAEYDLSIFDLAGRRWLTMDHGQAKPGIHVVAFDPRSINARAAGVGVYFLRLRVGTSIVTQRVVVMR